jgi:hypothetical protein
MTATMSALMSPTVSTEGIPFSLRTLLDASISDAGAFFGLFDNAVTRRLCSGSSLSSDLILLAANPRPRKTIGSQVAFAAIGCESPVHGPMSAGVEKVLDVDRF